MQSTWVKVLRALREQKHFALFALVSALEDIELTDSQIIIKAHNDSELQMLKKNWALLTQLAGSDCLVLQDRTNTEAVINTEYVEKLKDLFGDKVEIV